MLLLVLVSLRHLRRPLVAGLLLGLSVSRGYAQDLGVEAQTVQSLDGGPFLMLAEAELGQPWEIRAGLAANHARGLVVLVDQDGTHDLLQQVTTEEPGVSVRLGELVRVGLAMPSHTRVYFDGDRYEAVPGDLSVWAHGLRFDGARIDTRQRRGLHAR